MRTVIIYLSMLVLSATCFAQERSGYVVNRGGEPVDFATVVLLKEGNQVAAAITDTEGHFTFTAETGNYLLKVQNITYKTLEEEVQLTSDNGELGTFSMEDGVFGLDAVVVTASTITREADRFVMQVNNNIPTLMNKDAAEVLQLAPGVWVDDEGISINGTRGTKVFINNRELKLTSKELAAYLRNYRSSDIARVEVIPQAGAEYSADSGGGIIRIILRKKQDNCIDGNVILQTSQGKYYENYRPSATINALSGKWMWNASATGSITPKNETEMMEARSYQSPAGNRFESLSYMKSKPSLGMGRVGVIYELNDRNGLGAEVEFWAQEEKTFSTAETSGILEDALISSESDYRQKENNRNLSTTLDYMYRLDTIGSIVKFVVDYTQKKVTGNNDYQSLYHSSYGSVDSVYRSNSKSDYGIYTADVMADKKLRNGMKIAAGARYTHNKVLNRAFYEGEYNSVWNPLDDYNYSLDYKENISAVYGTFSTDIGGFSLLAGVRGEYTQTTGKGEVDKKYFDLFPNLTASYAFNPMYTFMLIGQYARNIQRPNFWHLNSNRVQYSDYSYMIGNPQLRPTYINRVSLTAVYNYRYTLTVGANMYKDLIREVTKTDPTDADVKYIIPENHYMENHYFININCPVRFAKWLSVNTNFTGVKQDIREIKGDKVSAHYLYFIHSTAAITLPADFFLEFTYSGTSRLYSANSGIEPAHLLHTQLKKKLLNNRLNVSLGMHNLFNHKAAYFADMGTYMNTSEIMDGRNSRTVKISLQYNFKSGKSVKKRTVENDPDARKERLERGSGMK